jgi:hypothetical protein
MPRTPLMRRQSFDELFVAFAFLESLFVMRNVAPQRRNLGRNVLDSQRYLQTLLLEKGNLGFLRIKILQFFPFESLQFLLLRIDRNLGKKNLAFLINEFLSPLLASLASSERIN